MTQIVMTSRVGPDGTLTLALPADAAGQEVRVTVEPAAPRTLTAADLLQSGLVGLWADRTDLGSSQEFARRLREQAQTRRPAP
jgi:hypothetical protein